MKQSRYINKVLGVALCLFAVAAFLCLTSCIKDNEDQDEDWSLQVGDSLPQFTVTMSDGIQISTGDLTGTVSCIMLFSTTCPDCQQTFPVIQQLYQEYGIGAGGDSSETVRFVCISREEGNDIVSQYWSENDLTLPYSAQENREVYNLFATRTVPRVYISDPGTVIRASYTDSPIPTYDEIVQDFESLL